MNTELEKLVKEIRRELKKRVDLEYRGGERRFFKEKIKNYGVRMPERRKVAKTYFKKIREMKKLDVFNLAEQFLKTGYSEEATVGFSFVFLIKEKFEKKDFKVFERWVKKYVDNWAKCDDFCTHSVGFLINQYPELGVKLFSWTKSKNRWVKRASAVSLIYPFGKKKKFLDQIFMTAAILLEDPDDMVQKGYGWMLKEASNHNQLQVFNFVMKNKDKMPRTALRYAIEKMPQGLKRKAMR